MDSFNSPNSFIKEIVELGIPLTDKIFLSARSSKLGVNQNGIQYIENHEHEEMVSVINRALFDFAKKAVACKDKAFLEEFVKEHST